MRHPTAKSPVETNDIGFFAVEVRAKPQAADAGAKEIEPGVYFRMELGGITGRVR